MTKMSPFGPEWQQIQDDHRSDGYWVWNEFVPGALPPMSQKAWLAQRFIEEDAEVSWDEQYRPGIGDHGLNL